MMVTEIGLAYVAHEAKRYSGSSTDIAEDTQCI